MTATGPHVLLSAAVSLDGYLDDATDQRLMLSDPADMDRVRRLRGEYDAILVGGATVRKDNPALAALGGPDPTKIVISADGRLDPTARFFTQGSVDKLVWCGHRAAPQTRRRLAGVARVEAMAGFDDLPRLLEGLPEQGVRRLMVEGGSRILTEFLSRGLADELRLAMAPFFVGDERAPRFVLPASFANDGSHRAQLTELGQCGDMAVLHYALGE